MKFRLKLIVCIIFLATVFLIACNVPHPSADTYEITVDNNKITLFVGESCYVTASAFYNGEGVELPALIWTSSDQSIATVDNGHINAIGLGCAKITVKYENTQKEIIVNCVGEITVENVNSFDEKYINIFGRHYSVDDGLKLDQTANAVEIGIIGKSFFVELTSNNLSYMQVFVDGENVGRIEVSYGKNTYKVADGLEEGYHIIRLVKDTEMQYGEWTVHSFDADRFASVPEKSELKIEFIGDSLTAGYGSIGKMGEAWSVKNSSAIEAYGYKTASLLGADFSIVAWSGICTKAYMWTDINMATLYSYNSFANRGAYSFDDEPDVVVINLGTNDASYIMDGHKDYEERFLDDYLEFLNFVRKKNPNAYIICLYGLAGEHPGVAEGIKVAVALMDDKVIYNPFEFIPNASGVNGHPTKEAYDEWAKALAKYIETLKIE